MTAAESRDAADVEMVGRFGYDSNSGRWRWDDAAALLHGWDDAHPESLTTDQLLALVYEEDRAVLLESLAKPAGAHWRLRYRVPASEAELRSLLLVAHDIRSRDEGYLAEGLVIDVTGDLHEAGEVAGRAAVEAVTAGRGAIEQAKGVLMLAYSLTEDQAFELLRWWSRNHNVRVRLLAERLMAAAQRGDFSDPDLRVRMDRGVHDLTIEPSGQ
ncbi:ANTAR domain-containing protein [Nocardioides sp. BP30]|uniref:ANTAR domain-containing protein n=1 Tax=Nocardioides sp. BP30 TaxID=3036374 RepID=UPI0024690D98|nr:ANTAR domain-containing protein [Nocardioides sp. BP30]WGL52364.1 ANTAR domain-containing protein [Nocardioides sp. BP30]